MAIDYSKSIMEIVEKHLSPTPTYLEKRKCFGTVGLMEDAETSATVGAVKAAACEAIASSEVKPFAGGLMRKTRNSKRTTGKKK